MTDVENAEIDKFLKDLGRAMIERGVTPNGFVALAAFTSFMGALVILGGAGKWLTRVLAGIIALALAFKPFRDRLAEWLGGGP